MAHEPTFSVGIPTYNQSDYLRETIRSVLLQRLPPTEIVVSDNHSTDQTSSVLAEFSGLIRVIRPPVHLPMTAHWNFLVSQLRGSWISLLSSDDIAKPNFVGTLQQGISLSDTSVLVRSGWENIDAEQHVIERRHLLSVQKITPAPENLLEQLTGPKTSFAAFAVKKSAWETVGGFPECLSLLGDWGLWLRLAPIGEFIYIHDIISQYRTDYRPAIQAQRALPWLRDETEISMKIIPEIAFDRLKLEKNRVLQARRFRLKQCLNEGIKIVRDSDRLEAYQILSEWAKSTGQLALLDSFRQGTFRVRSSKSLIAKRVLRSIYERLFV